MPQNTTERPVHEAARSSRPLLTTVFLNFSTKGGREHLWNTQQGRNWQRWSHIFFFFFKHSYFSLETELWMVPSVNSTEGGLCKHFLWSLHRETFHFSTPNIPESQFCLPFNAEFPTLILHMASLPYSYHLPGILPFRGFQGWSAHYYIELLGLSLAPMPNAC